MKTYVAKDKDIKRKIYLVDADGQVLGRLAARVASILRGKHKPIYTPHIDTGDQVIIINAANVTVTGRKRKEKIYTRFSGYPGGLKRIVFEDLMKKKPTEAVMHAVKGMLPKGPLGRKMLTKLRVYSNSSHKHQAQKPEILKI